VAGMTPEAPRSHKRKKDLLGGTAAVEPAIAASAERAAIERADTAPVADAQGADPLAPAPAAVIAPETGTAVLPEPTLVAEPGGPMPIVTASPILAIEPSAVDVVQADAAANRVAAGLEPTADQADRHDAAAGQPTLTIEGSDAARAAHRLADGALGAGILLNGPGQDILGQDAGGAAVGQLDGGEATRRMVDDIVYAMRQFKERDEEAFEDVLERIFDADEVFAPRAVTSAGPTVTVIEVVGPLLGRRRAGRTFGAQPQRFLASELGVDELAALRADPLLAVGVTEMPEADALAAVLPG
jgi:uncharacterized Zn-binding protein involved in type VI secretion